jgi:hypothetical protein
MNVPWEDVKADYARKDAEIEKLKAMNSKLENSLERVLNAVEMRKLLPEPVAYMFQHEETGVTGFVEVQQVEWGFQENNPRLQIICPLYRLPLSEGE